MKKEAFRIILVVAVMLSAVAGAMACVEESVSDYASNPFLITRPMDASRQFDEGVNNETIEFWGNYTGGAVAKDSISSFFKKADYAGFKPAGSKSPFIKWLVKNGRNDALDYITLCLELNTLTSGVYDQVWYYDKPDKSHLKTFWDKIKDKTGKGDLQMRYKLLKVRTLGAMKDDTGLIGFWKKEGGTIPDTQLGRRIKGYVGGAYYRKHDYVTALDYFDSACDPQSVAWCVEQLVGAKNLEKLYEHSPNSIALDYVMQDYVNYLIEAVGDPESYTSSNSFKHDYYKIPLFDPKSEIKGFLKIADRALSEGNVNNPMAWATAKGVVTALAGNYEEGLKILEGAATLKGDKLAQENLDRFTGWALLMTWDGRQNEKASRLADFIRTYSAKGEREKAKIQAEDLWYDIDQNDKIDYEFFVHFFASEADKVFSRQHPGRAIAFMQYMEDCGNGFNSDGFLGKMRSRMWEGMPVSELQKVIDYTDNPLTTDVDKVFVSSLKDMHCLSNDVMGTRLILAARFGEAIPYLENVNTKYIVSTATYPYLNRGFYSALWGEYNFQRGDFSVVWSPYYSSNTKLEYCREMVKLLEEYSKMAYGQDKAKQALRIAAMMHVASPTGDCWALSDYSLSISELHSEMTDHCRYWLNKSLADGATDREKAIAYYALILLPVNDDITPLKLDSHDKWNYELPTAELKNQLMWLHANFRSGNDYPDFITGCDALLHYTL